ncbi:MAG TPA: hypothetical protein VD884_19100 [Ohtaekwangia sp.]|nr:hypothetical protein [Ohtaekwangia sp.]
MPLKYELAKLETVVSQDISDFIRMNYKLDQKLFQRFTDRIHQETESVKNNFSRAMLYFKNKQALARYIRFHQRAIIELSGHLTKYVQPHEITSVTPSSQDKAKLSQELYSSLQDLLAFVGKHFAEHFDMDAWIPESYRLIVYDDIQRNIENMQSGLEHKGFDRELITLTLAPFKEFLQRGSANEITYRRVMFIKELRKDLFYLLMERELRPDDNINELLQWILFGLNYNSPEYVGYCTRQIKTFIDKTEDLTEKLERLALVQKLIHQQSPKRTFIYDTGRKSLPELLKDWMDQETCYLETRKTNLITQSDGIELSSDKFKLQVDLSVAQLAYFIRVFVEVSIIQNPNVTVMLRYIARIFQTKRSKVMGYGSIYSKYYNAEDSVRKTVKEMLQKMISYIDKDVGAA